MINLITMDKATGYTQPQLPPGWVQAVDPNTGRNYYANATTGESSWNAPHLYNGLAHHEYYHQEYIPPIDNAHRYNNHHTIGSYSVGMNDNHHYNGQVYAQHQEIQFQPWSQSNKVDGATNFRNEDSHIHANVENNDNTYDSKDFDDTDPIDFELRLLSAGQIADICYMQQQQHQAQNSSVENVGIVPYSTPIPMQQLQRSELLNRPIQEIGRLHTRYYTLREQLKQFKSV
jgi:hypothetical protein